MKTLARKMVCGLADDYWKAAGKSLLKTTLHLYCCHLTAAILTLQYKNRANNPLGRLRKTMKVDDTKLLECNKVATLLLWRFE